MNEPTVELYIPPYCYSLDKVAYDPQIRLGLQGYGGSGKTWAGLTFPNPIEANLDRSLGAHVGRSDVIEVPFYSEEFCKKYDSSYTLRKLKTIWFDWLLKEGTKLQQSQTLIIDNLTNIQNAYHAWYQDNIVYTKGTGLVNDFAEYKLKKQYFGEMMELIKTFKCNVVLICHETDASIGKSAGKLRPLLSGQFGDELLSYFTDFFRQLSADKPADFNAVDDATLKKWDMNKQQYRNMCDTFPRNTIYYWQTEGDNMFDGKCTSLVKFPRYLPADYKSFLKYQRPKQLTT